MHRHKVSVALREGIFHMLASILHVTKLRKLLIKKNSTSWWKGWQKNKSMFADIIENTSSTLCLDLQHKRLLDGTQKVPNFFLSSKYYRRPDIILNTVSTEL